MVLEEQPAKLAEALRHFLQGLGYGNNMFYDSFDIIIWCFITFLSYFSPTFEYYENIGVS